MPRDRESKRILAMISAFSIFDKAATTVKFRHLQAISIFSILILTLIIIIFFTYQANDSTYVNPGRST